MRFLEGRFLALGFALLSLMLGVLFEEPLSDIFRDFGFEGSRLSSTTRMAISGVVCFILGVAFAGGVLRNPTVDAWMTARRLRKLNDLEASFGKPTAGWLPRVDDSPSEDFRDTKSHIFEAMSSITDRVLNDFTETQPKRILITSGVPGDGKTTVASGLAIMLARRGRRVLLIDADLRAPSQHRIFGFRNDFGLANLVAGSNEIERAISLSDIPDLFVMCSGPPLPNPGELLSGGIFDSILVQAHNQFDVVVIDSPPVLGLADTPALARQCDFILYVVRYGVTNTKLTTDTFKRISSIARAPMVLVGTALPTRAMGFGYSYLYGYSESLSSRRAKLARMPAWRRSITYGWRIVLVGLIFFGVYGVSDYLVPDRLDQVGGGVVSVRSLNKDLEVRTWHGDYYDVDHALESGEVAIKRLAAGLKNGLPPLNAATKRVSVHLTFTKEDRLGNPTDMPFISLSFDLEDLRRVNTSKIRGPRLLGLAREAFVWKTGWPEEMSTYCKQHKASKDAATLCAAVGATLSPDAI